MPSKRSRKDEVVEGSPSSTASGKNSKKIKRSNSPASTTAALYDADTGRIDTRIVENSVASLVAGHKSERYDDLDENMTREELQTRYQDLRDLRVTAAEKLLKDVLSAHKKESEAQQGLVENYKRRATDLQGRLDTLEQQKQNMIKDEVELRVEEVTEEVEARMNATVAALQAEFKKERATLTAAAKGGVNSHSSTHTSTTTGGTEQDVEHGYFKSVAKAYEDLTGLRIVMENWEDGAAGGLQCTAVNKETQKLVQFSLELDDDVEEGEEIEWDYTPGAHMNVLPAYLHEEISFPTSAAPKFVTRLVDALCSKK